MIDVCNTNQMTNIDQKCQPYIRANTKRRAKVDEDSEGSMIKIRLWVLWTGKAIKNTRWTSFGRDVRTCGSGKLVLRWVLKYRYFSPDGSVYFRNFSAVSFYNAVFRCRRPVILRVVIELDRVYDARSVP